MGSTSRYRRVLLTSLLAAAVAAVPTAVGVSAWSAAGADTTTTTSTSTTSPTNTPPSSSLPWPDVPIMGPATLTADQLVNFYNSRNKAPNPNLTVTLPQLAGLFISEGAREGVRGDVAFAQSIIETGWFGYVGSMVQPTDNNFAGMGACDSCSSGRQFPTAQIGVRAQIQSLRDYADPGATGATLPDPPVPQWYAWPSLDPQRAIKNFDHFMYKGQAPMWNGLSGKWATGPGYGSAILSLYNQMLSYNNMPTVCPPTGLGFGITGATACPAPLQHPGRAIAANPKGGYYVLNGNGTVTGVGGAPRFGQMSWSWDIGRDIAAMPDGKGYIILDGWGGIHKFGSATQGVMGSLVPNMYWQGWDIARSIVITPSGQGFAILDGWGGIHYFGDAPALEGPYWPQWDIARSLKMTSTGQGYYVLDGWGGVHTLGDAVWLGTPSYWQGWDIARSIVTTGDGNGYAVLDGFGGVHPVGVMRVVKQDIGWYQADRWSGITSSNGQYYVVRDDGYVAMG